MALRNAQVLRPSVSAATFTVKYGSTVFIILFHSAVNEIGYEPIRLSKVLYPRGGGMEQYELRSDNTRIVALCSLSVV